MSSKRVGEVKKATLPSRRDFFGRVGDGLFGGTLAYLLGNDLFGTNLALAASTPRVADLKPRPAHFEPKAKSVIQLFMNGGPSQVDLFDPKPALEKYRGQSHSREIANNIENNEDAGGLMPSPFKFVKSGQSGTEIANVMPHLAKQVDDIALIRSMFTTHFTHEPALFIMQTGRMLSGRPSMGAWVVYKLGSENQNLPGYVVLDDPKGLPINAIQNWQQDRVSALPQRRCPDVRYLSGRSPYDGTDRDSAFLPLHHRLAEIHGKSCG